MRITIRKNGPYEVFGPIPLNQERIGCDAQGVSHTWQKGPVYDTQGKESYSLCRCGHSEKKPFCDGSHRARGFVGEEWADRPPYEKRAVLFQGATLDLLDDETLCVGARFCDRDGTIWRRMADTRDPAARSLVLEEAANCPGGRLTVVDKDGVAREPALAREISLVEDPVNNWRGPLWVKGGIQVEGEGGEIYQNRNRVTLCRCGESANMPYCDATHYECPHMEGLDSPPGA